MRDGPSYQEKLAGRARLRRLLPEARRILADGNGPKIKVFSDIAKAMFAHVSESNLDSVAIYRAPLGGWHCDMILKHTPPGVSNAFGTPINAPLKSRETAEDHALNLVLMALTAVQQGTAEAPPVFELFDWTVTLRPEVLDEIEALDPSGRHGFMNKAHAHQRIESEIRSLERQGWAIQELDAWPRDPKAKLMILVHLAAKIGVLRHPPGEHKPPEPG